MKKRTIPMIGICIALLLSISVIAAYTPCTENEDFLRDVWGSGCGTCKDSGEDCGNDPDNSACLEADDAPACSPACPRVCSGVNNKYCHGTTGTCTEVTKDCSTYRTKACMPTASQTSCTCEPWGTTDKVCSKLDC